MLSEKVVSYETEIDSINGKKTEELRILQSNLDSNDQKHHVEVDLLKNEMAQQFEKFNLELEEKNKIIEELTPKVATESLKNLVN